MDASFRRLPEPKATTFDVRTWLADLGHYSPDEVRYVDESSRAGFLVVRYSCAGAIVKVRASTIGGVAAAAWELTAGLPAGPERVVVPGRTHFLWRPVRGTHG